MESWSFDSKDKMGSTDWEIKSPFENNMLFMTQNAATIENQGSVGTCFPQIVGNTLLSPVMAATHNEFHDQNELSSDLSSSIVESNYRASALFDLITQMPSKQKRNTGFDFPSPFCKVHGCNKSLVSCKDYHKRHKVCELHSKTDKVIVNGIEQRFCQQCSRFHSLSEFDDGKRSCRKRLADHNQRRRKPYSGRHGRSLPPNSSKFKGRTRTKANSTSMSDELRSMSSITDVQHYSSLHGDNYRYAQPEDFITMDSTSALSLLSYQSQGSSCHPSRNLLSQNNINPNGVWSSDVSTIDLFQLSSQLERVELQKEIFRSKCNNGGNRGVQ